MSHPSFQPTDAQMIDFFSPLVGVYNLNSRTIPNNYFEASVILMSEGKFVPTGYKATVEMLDKSTFVVKMFKEAQLVLTLEYYLNDGAKIRRVMTDKNNVIEDIFDVWIHDGGSLEYKCEQTNTRPKIQGKIQKSKGNPGFVVSNFNGENFILDTFKPETN